jgi:hypothetical protein
MRGEAGKCAVSDALALALSVRRAAQRRATQRVAAANCLPCP